MYNSQQALYLYNSFFTENGFMYNKNISLKNFLPNEKTDSVAELKIKKEFIRDFSFNNSYYIEFLM